MYEIQKVKKLFPEIPPVTDDPALLRRPFWSVVIAVRYDRCEFLRRAITSVVSQWTYDPDDMELVVVHAKALEPHRAAVAEIVKSCADGRVRLAQYEDDLIYCENWNRVIAHSRGQYVHFLHDDDYVLPGFYQTVRRKAEATGAMALCTGYENIDDAGRVILSKKLSQADASAPLPALPWRKLLLHDNHLNPPAVVFHRSVYETLGGYAPVATIDWEFYIRVSRFYDWYHIPKILVRYRQHDTPAQQLLVGRIKRTLDFVAQYVDINEINEVKASYFDAIVNNMQNS